MWMQCAITIDRVIFPQEMVLNREVCYQLYSLAYMYIDELLSRLTQSGYGYMVGHLFCGAIRVC